jgi:GT2 family glycosyltransferase
MNDVTVLIPTYQRTTALAVMLTSLYFQTYQHFEVVISDQNDQEDIFSHPSSQTIIRLLNGRGIPVKTYKHLPRLGLAEQRQFLLDHSQTTYSLFLDDDLIVEPYVIEKMKQAITEEHCGFVGRPVVGLSYVNDYRPEEEAIELWKGPVKPEIVRKDSKKWDRYKLHNAANMYHVEQKLHVTPEQQIKYKVAWIGACVMYDTQKLREAGGFQFWHKLPKNHAGEDALAQLRVMKQFGGCGLLPSGVYHQEVPTTVTDRRVNAPDFLQVEV